MKGGCKSDALLRDVLWMPSSWLEWFFFSCMQILSKYCKPYIKNFNMWTFFSPITITADLVPSENIIHLNSNCCLLSSIFAFILAPSAAYLFHSNQIILLKNVQKKCVTLLLKLPRLHTTVLFVFPGNKELFFSLPLMHPCHPYSHILFRLISACYSGLFKRSLIRGVPWKTESKFIPLPSVTFHHINVSYLVTFLKYVSFV